MTAGLVFFAAFPEVFFRARSSLSTNEAFCTLMSGRISADLIRVNATPDSMDGLESHGRVS